MSTSPSPGVGLALVVGLGVAASGLAGCAFHPDGGPPPIVGDGSVLTDADEGAIDAALPVADARVIDARPVDARPPFDVDACPAGYVRVVGQPSLYRMIDPVGWAGAQAACKLHSAGLSTHLAVFSGQGERDAVGAALFFGGDHRRTWLGVWHDGTGARTVTGEPLYPTTPLGPGQAVSWVRDLTAPFRADGIGMVFAGLCECDGLPSTP